VIVEFAGTTPGRVVLLSGSVDGNTKPSYAYEHFQTTLADTWVINHGLGHEPIVRVFIGNQEVQPASITFNTLNQVTITFTQAYVGIARLI
jgi:chloramphenicol 3-O-phosphotransferase